MPTLSRKIALSCLALGLVCFCSCERHRANELPAEEEHAKSGAPDAKERPGQTDEEVAHDQALQEEKRAHDTDAGAPAAVADVPGTPVQFFPSSSPSPSPR